MKDGSRCKKALPLSIFNPRGKEDNYKPKSHCKACELDSWRRLNLRDKSLVFSYYGSSCACCGEGNIAFLTIDHIAGGGSAHRKSFGGSIYRWLKLNNFPSGFQTLCMNCNFAKSKIVGGCPHMYREEYARLRNSVDAAKHL